MLTPSPRRRGAVDAVDATPSRRQNPKSKTNNHTEHRLVLKMNTSSTGLDHELRELHDGREAAVAGVAVGHNGSQVVDVLPTRKRPAVVVF